MAVIPQGSKVLVTGISGYIGSNVADQLLALGYTVRGTSRSHKSAEWVVEYLDKKHGKGKVEIYEVTDMAAEDAYDEAVKGVSGIAHLATIGSATEGFHNDPKAVITPVVASTTNIISSAKKEHGVKAAVLTSSSAGTDFPRPNEEVTVTEDQFNEEAIHAAWNDPDVNGFIVYGASKAEGEKHFWKRAKNENVAFQVCTVVPSANFGPVTKPQGELSSSTGSWIPMLWSGQPIETLGPFAPSWYVNVVDTAKLVVIGLTDSGAANRRLFAYSEPWNWTAVLEIIRKHRPDHKLPVAPKDEARDLSKVPNQFAESLLQKNYGHGFVSLEQAVKENIAGLT